MYRCSADWARSFTAGRSRNARRLASTPRGDFVARALLMFPFTVADPGGPRTCLETGVAGCNRDHSLARAALRQMRCGFPPARARLDGAARRRRIPNEHEPGRSGASGGHGATHAVVVVLS
jgi:hypothetical protein